MGIGGHPYWVGNSTSSLAAATLGILLVVRRPEHSVGWLLLSTGILGGLAVFTGEYGVYAVIGARDPTPTAAIAEWVGDWSWWLALAPLILVILTFPSGRLRSERWRLLAGAAIAGIALATMSDALTPGPLRLLPGQNPVGITGTEPALSVIKGIGTLMAIVSAAAGAVALLLRLRHADGVEREQLKWFAYASAVAVVLLVGGVPLDGLIGVRVVAPVTSALGSILPLAAVTIAILQYRLYEIDQLINRTLVFGGLSLAVVLLYVVLVAYLGALLQGAAAALPSLLSTAAVALLFQPLRDRLQRGVNRLMYGDRDEPYMVLSRLGQRLETTLAPDALLPTVVQTMGEALKLPYVAITLDEDGDAISTAYGVPNGEVARWPLNYQGETLGELQLAPRAPGEAFSRADQHLLDDLARQAGVAAHAVRLTSALRRSQERLVTAREEERRRLRRDLHDGVGPRLASVTLQLAALRNRLGHDAAASESVSLLKQQVQDAVDDIRRLVQGLRPPALDELGLIGAIAEQAARYQTPGVNGSPHARLLEVTLEVPERLPPLPAAVEVAAYRITSEALTNVAHHADARMCSIRLSLAEKTGTSSAVLRIEVIDDGCGLPSAHRVGTGLVSMRERAMELGGTCRVALAPQGGTCVLAELPLPSFS